MKTIAANLKKGDFILLDKKIWQVINVEFNYRGRGSALAKIKIKSIKDSNTVTKTFRSENEIQLVDIQRRKLSYLYKDTDKAIFMDQNSFQQYEADISIIKEAKPFLHEGKEYLCYLYQDKIIKVNLPNQIKVKVIKAEEAIKGDRVSAGKKTIVVEGNITILAPLFIKKGEEIIINPETKEYIERA